MFWDLISGKLLPHFELIFLHCDPMIMLLINVNKGMVGMDYIARINEENPGRFDGTASQIQY
jgi:hypothetical protein